MYKYREIVYDVMSDLKQVYDDKQITEYHVLWYVSTIGSLLLKQHLDNEYGRTGRMSGRYLSIFPDVEVITTPVASKNVVPNRKYVSLPAILLDFDFERAVHYITYYRTVEGDAPAFQNIQFQRTTPGIAQGLNATFEKPTPDNPYFYIVGNNVYFLGVENVKVDKVEMGLFLALDPRTVVSMEDDCPLPPHLVSQLKYQIINLGRFVLSIPQDKVNDGNDMTLVAPPKQVNENEQQ
jgi:hypothetical protein